MGRFFGVLQLGGTGMKRRAIRWLSVAALLGTLALYAADVSGK
jgi:hypothetical protein